MKKYTKQGYKINPQPLTIDSDYEKVYIKYDFGNNYEYFIENIDEKFTEPLLYELDILFFVYNNYGQNKVTGTSITGFFSVVG